MSRSMYDATRCFGGTARLYGEQAYQQLQSAHVVVVGIGGVGSWAAEALARSAVGRVTLIDLDTIAESNTNRQLHTLTSTYGQDKTLAMQQRIAQINPLCQVQCIDDFVTEDNALPLLTQIHQQDAIDYVLDCIDVPRAKIALYLAAKRLRIPLMMAGGAGGKTDPTQIAVADLSQSIQDPLLARIRQHLRQQHGLPSAPKLMRIPVVYSRQAMQRPSVCETQNKLNCGGFGSSVMVTATFGMMMAAHALHKIS
jgi:tRNA A37 threonylcarbamoyladenosine dehydratase